MALIKDGVVFRTYEEQVAYLTAKKNEQDQINVSVGAKLEGLGDDTVKEYADGVLGDAKDYTDGEVGDVLEKIGNVGEGTVKEYIDTGVSGCVKTTGDQTVNGFKTFSKAVTSPSFNTNGGNYTFFDGAEYTNLEDCVLSLPEDFVDGVPEYDEEIAVKSEVSGGGKVYRHSVSFRMLPTGKSNYIYGNYVLYSSSPDAINSQTAFFNYLKTETGDIIYIVCAETTSGAEGLLIFKVNFSNGLGTYPTIVHCSDNTYYNIYTAFSSFTDKVKEV